MKTSHKLALLIAAHAHIRTTLLRQENLRLALIHAFFVSVRDRQVTGAKESDQRRGLISLTTAS